MVIEPSGEGSIRYSGEAGLISLVGSGINIWSLITTGFNVSHH